LRTPQGFKTWVPDVEAEVGWALGASADASFFAYPAFSAVLRLLIGRRRSEFVKDIELIDYVGPVREHSQPRRRAGERQSSSVGDR
jgi:hypothetical protein